jgi:signal transduction histidine kinase
MTYVDVATALPKLVGRVFARRGQEDPAALTEHLRAIYRDYVFNSPLVICISVYLYAVRADLRPWPFLQAWMPLWVLYLSARMAAGLLFAQAPALDPLRLKRWSRLSLLIQLVDGLMVSSLGWFVYPQLDPMAQSALLAATLVLVGATAFSLSGRWLSIAVYAPLVYLSFAWMTWQQTHPYATGFAVFTLGMFALYLVYASNQRKSVLKGFELAKLNGQLADELMVKNVALEGVASERSRLLATVSHDLRQPAHAIGLLAERALLDSSPESTRQCLRDLNELSQSLSASLVTLMDLTRLDAGLVEPREMPVELGQILARLEGQFDVVARGKGLRLLVARCDLWVRCDPVLLQALLANLVSNAIKYTAHGIVELKVSEVDNRVCVRVCDTGIGIRHDKLESIFNEFVRLQEQKGWAWDCPSLSAMPASWAWSSVLSRRPPRARAFRCSWRPVPLFRPMARSQKNNLTRRKRACARCGSWWSTTWICCWAAWSKPWPAGAVRSIPRAIWCRPSTSASRSPSIC